MTRFVLALAMLILAAMEPTKAQNPVSLLIKGGHVIDPKNNIDEVMDVAIAGGKIKLVAKNIATEGATQVVNADGMYVCPGLIDMHTHVFLGCESNSPSANESFGIQPDGFTFRNGVTTIVDAGTSGWKNFPAFKSQTIDNSKTRVLAFLNIVGGGMRSGYEQNENDMDPKMASIIARQNKEYIVGFKLAHYEGHNWRPTDKVVEAGRLAGNLPVMIDFGGSTPPLSIKELFLEHLRPGDIFTHCFGQLNTREYIYDLEAGRVKPFVWEARQKGISFDVGYGGISFSFSQAIPCIKEGFFPQSISTDLHIGSMNAAMKDMLTTMSKFLAIGMDLKSVIAASTWNPAKEIQRYELGNLSVGAPADVAILDLRKGNFGLFDYTGYRVKTDKKLECQMTIRDGKIVYDLNGIAEPLVIAASPSNTANAGETVASLYKNIRSENKLQITPHSSINEKEFFRQYQKNPEWWNKAFLFLNTTDWNTIKPGDYIIDSNNVIAHVSEGVPQNINEIRWEAHREFNDLQYIIKGKAKMGVAPVIDQGATPLDIYSSKDDAVHFTNDNGIYYIADPDMFFIFSPMEMHRPSIKTDGKGVIRKVVIKVRVP